jgi:tripartite-type tricarboxylate transporter receptor subunit TctC
MSKITRTVRCMAALAAVALLAAGCSSGVTSKPAVTFPKANKSITMIVPFAPGGLTDISARVLAPALADELGVTVEVVNKPGASSQIGLTGLSQSKPDGYTFGYTLLPTTPNAYLDPARKAAFDADSFIGFANYFSTPIVAVVNKDSKFKTVADLVAAAKANPAKVSVGTGALGGPADMGRVLLEQSTGIQFANVQFDGGGPTNVALLGGHIDAAFSSVPEVLQYVKSGQSRVLGVMSAEEVSLLPGAKTFKSEGFDLTMASTGVISVPAGTPKAIVERLSEATRIAMETAEVIKKADELGFLLQYMTPDEVAKEWAASEEQVRSIRAAGGK